MAGLDILAKQAAGPSMSASDIVAYQLKLGKKQMTYEALAQRLEKKYGLTITFGRVLQEMRWHHGWRQNRIAMELDVSQVTVSKWENDRAWPTGIYMAGIILLIPEIAPVMRIIWPTAYDWVDHVRILEEDN